MITEYKMRWSESKKVRCRINILSKGYNFVPNNSVQIVFGFLNKIVKTKNTKGKFEEDRFSKQQEEKWCEKLRVQRAEEDLIREQKYYEHVVAPVKEDIASLLAKTGDSISDQGLENLAKSRLGPWSKIVQEFKRRISMMSSTNSRKYVIIKNGSKSKGRR